MRYHAVAPDDAPLVYASPDVTIPRTLFAAQMRFLKRIYIPVSIGDIVDALARGEKLPPGSPGVTIDDGYADNWHHALPVLRDLQIPATVYIATEGLNGGPPLWTSELRAVVMASRSANLRLEVGGRHEFDLASSDARQRALRTLTNLLVPLEPRFRRRILASIRRELEVHGDADVTSVMLTSEQIRGLRDSGITIGAHSQTHSNMTLISSEQARAEIGGSRQQLEAIIGAPVIDFAYPNTGGEYPHFNDAVMATVRELGFRSAATSVPGPVTPMSDRYKLPRVGVAPRVYPRASLAARKLSSRMRQSASEICEQPS